MFLVSFYGIIYSLHHNSENKLYNLLKQDIMNTFKLLFAAVILATGFSGFAQTGEIQGKVMNESSKEGIPFSHVYVVSGPSEAQTTADENGRFKLTALTPGIYSIAFQDMMHTKKIISDIKVSSNNIADVNGLLAFNNELDTFAVVEERWEIKLIDKFNISLQKIDGKDLSKTAFAKDPKAGITTMFSGVTMVPGTTGQISVRGARPIETAYYVDGVKTPDGNLNVPGISISTIQVYTSGVPAQYGDVTGGVVAVETKGYFDLLNNK